LRSGSTPMPIISERRPQELKQDRGRAWLVLLAPGTMLLALLLVPCFRPVELHVGQAGLLVTTHHSGSLPELIWIKRGSTRVMTQELHLGSYVYTVAGSWGRVSVLRISDDTFLGPSAGAIPQPSQAIDLAPMMPSTRPTCVPPPTATAVTISGSPSPKAVATTVTSQPVKR
ncbi:MAG: hypothetical protein K0Q72_3679, partial [Armatimonadetes bacterium]|nr:hypothetical protein [Armatimonadota bacterium]